VWGRARARGAAPREGPGAPLRLGPEQAKKEKEIAAGDAGGWQPWCKPFVLERRRPKRHGAGPKSLALICHCRGISRHNGLGRCLLSKLERRAFTQHRLGLVRVAAASLMQHEAGKEAKAGAASLFRLHNDADRRLAFFREEWEQANCAETPVEQRQQLGESLRHMDQGDPTLWRGEGGEETDPGIKRSLLHDV